MRRVRTADEMLRPRVQAEDKVCEYYLLIQQQRQACTPRQLLNSLAFAVSMRVVIPCAGPEERPTTIKIAVPGSIVSMLFLAAAIGAGALGCGAPVSSAARSRHSFEWIQRQVTGRTEAEVERILGKPDVRESCLIDDELWIWWDYTSLEGEQYPPEMHGMVVHLEITFDKPPGMEGRDAPHAAWRVTGPFSVSFSRRVPMRSSR